MLHLDCICLKIMISTAIQFGMIYTCKFIFIHEMNSTKQSFNPKNKIKCLTKNKYQQLYNSTFFIH